MRKRFLVLILICCLLLLCSCGENEIAGANTDSDNSLTSSVEDEKTEHIKQILYRYIDGVDTLGENSNVKISGPITKNGNYYEIYVDTIPANGYGIKDAVRFYEPEDGNIEKSFSVTFAKDYNMKSLRDFIALTIYATDSNISHEKAQTEMNKMIANFNNDSPSNIYESEEYYIYVAPAHIVSGYTVEAVHKSEFNKSINKLDYKKLEHSAMASELNKGVACYITATPYEIIVNYPYAYIKVKDLQGNLYYLSGTYNNVLNNIEIDKQYNFYFVLAGKTINDEIYCGLRYFEQSQD